MSDLEREKVNDSSISHSFGLCNDICVIAVLMQTGGVSLQFFFLGCFSTDHAVQVIKCPVMTFCG